MVNELPANTVIAIGNTPPLLLHVVVTLLPTCSVAKLSLDALILKAVGPEVDRFVT